MKRKLIAQGIGGLTVSLPKEWIKKTNLKPRDEIDIIIEEDNSLKIISEKDLIFESSIDLNLKNKNKLYIKNKIFQTYRKGFTKVSITFSKEKKEFIEKLIKTIFGFEIVEQESQKIIIQNITEPGKDKFEIILSRFFISIIEECKNFQTTILESNVDEEKRIEYKNNIISYSNILRRIIINYKVNGDKNSYFLYQLITSFSNAYLALFFYITKSNENKLSTEMIKEYEIIFDGIRKNYFKENYENIFNILEKNQELLNEIQKLNNNIFLIDCNRHVNMALLSF